MPAYNPSFKDETLFSPLNKFYPNISKDQADALEEFTIMEKSQIITIKPCDKNGGVSVMNTCDYINESKRMLYSTYKSELLEFVKFLNEYHPTIKFKCKEGEHFDFETRSVNFLDTTLYIDNSGYIQSTLFTKPGKLCQYLLPTSSHPNHISKNIPYSLAYRLLRLESVREKLYINLEHLRSDLLSRKYDNKVIQNAFEKVLKLTRTADCLKKVTRKENNRIPLVITLGYQIFHTFYLNITPISERHFGAELEQNV